MVYRSGVPWGTTCFYYIEDGRGLDYDKVRFAFPDNLEYIAKIRS
jgi:hypothetical protein